MSIFFEQLNDKSCKTYLVKEKDSNEVYIIDPVLDQVNEYLEHLEKNDYSLKMVIDTHTHADHISGAAALKDHTDCEYLMHTNAPSQCVTKRVKEGDEIEIANVQVSILESHGHTRDSISLIFPDRIFTGDALFLDDGGAGRDDLPGGDPAAHWETLQKMMKLPEHLFVYPAHDYRDRKPSNLETQKKTNPFLKPRTKKEYVEFLEDLKLGPADWMKDVLKANYACARDPSAAWIPVDAPSCEVKGTLELGVNEMEVDSISAKELNRLMKENKTPYLIDVREPHELSAMLGHIQGVENIPIGKLVSKLGELQKIQDEEIVIICRSGSRAYTSAQIMKKAGFTNVKVLNGGMIAWRMIRK